jgi:DUF1016 N-terminal domain
MIQNTDYEDFIHDIKSKIRQSQYEAMKAVNKELLMLYWYIGWQIVQKQRELGWGNQ